ncbi:MAG: GDP-mannose 4,6-dehydratase [Planctomycetia bacterium]|nr:GDP-mannose 4,6-dehydratase [Planctomycetia bacterium]
MGPTTCWPPPGGSWPRSPPTSRRSRDDEDPPDGRRRLHRQRLPPLAGPPRARPTYAFDAEMPLREDSPQLPQTPYGTTKLAAERMIREYARAYDLGYAILRYFNASGADPDGKFGEARRHEGHLIPLILQVPLGKREKILIYGNDYATPDGTCVRDYVHTDDLAQAHQLAVEALEPGVGLAYNLGSGTGTSVLEVLHACESVVGRPIAHEMVGRRPGDPGTLIATPERISKELGWSPRFTDVRAIAETAWRWHSQHPDGYGRSDRG